MGGLARLSIGAPLSCALSLCSLSLSLSLARALARSLVPFWRRAAALARRSCVCMWGGVRERRARMRRGAAEKKKAATRKTALSSSRSSLFRAVWLPPAASPPPSLHRLYTATLNACERGMLEGQARAQRAFWGALPKNVLPTAAPHRERSGAQLSLRLDSFRRGGDNRYPHPRAPLSRDDHHLSAQAGWAREALPTSPWCGAERQRSLLRIFLSHLLALLARPLAVGIDGDVGHGFVHLCVYVCVRRVCVCVCSRSRSTRRTRRVSLLLPLTKEARVREWKRKKGVGVRVRIQRLISLRRASPCRRGSPCLPTDPRLMRPPLHRASKHGKSFGRHTLARSTLEV